MIAKRIVLVLALCLILTPFGNGSAHAQEPTPGPCEILIFGPDSYEFSHSECSSYVIPIWWFAATPGLVNEFLKAVVFSFSIEDSSGALLVEMDQEETKAFWLPPYEVSTDDCGITCPHRDTVWETRWPWNQDPLDAGVYYIHMELGFRHPLYDGLQQCTYNDGTPVGHPKYVPFMFETDVTLTITDD